MTDNTTESTQATTAAEDTDALKRKARQNAEKILRDRHADEFKELIAAEATKLGVTYVFRKTKEERAREQYEALLAEFPELAQRR